jgi:fimbrial isopeptide formation D2 family protein
MHRRSRLASLFLVLAVTAASLGLLASNAVFAGGNPLPIATVNNATGLIGETVTLTVTFDNASTGTGDQTGYGPYIDLFLDTTGPDGAPSFDGLVTTGMRATYLGQPLPGMEVIPITGPTYVHPLTGQTLSVPGYGTRFQNGDTIVVLTLPFGSFTNTQPPAPINVSLQISNLADLGTPLPVTAVAGFRYGADPLDNPGADPPIRQTTPSDANVTPTLWTLTKTYLGPEDETATGRNYPRRYRLDVDIAEGQPVTNLQITDVLANSMRITGNTAAQMSAIRYDAPGMPTEVFTPANLSGTATPAAPGGTLIYSFGDKTGVRGIDASFEFEFYIPRDTSAATPTVPQGTDSTFANNTGSSSATWTPIDTRDTSTPITITLPPNAHTLQQHSLATQKSVTPVDRNTLNPTTGGAIIPGSTLLRYDIDFQVSDYFAVQNVYLEDIISDGQRLFVRTSGGPSTVPTLQVENAYVTGASPTRTNIAAAPFSGTGVITYEQRFTTRGTPLSDPTSPPSSPVFTILTPAPSPSGTTYVRFDISQELIARGVSGRLVGGDIPNAGGAPQNNNPPLFGPTRGRITFYTEVKDEFSDDFPSGDRSVDQLDILRNTVPQIRGEQINTTTINNATPTVIGQATDDTAASVELPIGDRSKTLYALNGQTTYLGDPVTVQPGDLVTYRLTYRLPISSFENVQFIDFPPLPVFPVPDRLFFDASAAPGTIPGANMVSLGPGDTYLTMVNPPVTVRVATTGNITGYNPAGIGSFSGAPSMIDGVTLANGDRVLVKDQTDPRQNGVYVVVDAASGAWNRAADFDTAREITNGPLVGVTAGATNAGQHFRQANSTFNTFNTDAITWAPFITTDVYGNSFTFNFGWHDDVDGGRRTSLIDLLVTLRVADAAFANDLFLTNQLRINEFSTNAGSQYFDEIVMFEVIRPNVTINKGIVGYNNIGLTLGGVTFNPPDGSTDFSGTPVYTATQASAIGSSDVSLLSDAGDRVRYAIVLQNEGRGDAYDVTVTDTIPADYIRPVTLAAANFAVRRGNGTLLTGDVVSGTVRVATTAPLTGATYATSPNNGQFTNAPRTIDGVTLNVGDRVLVKDQSVASQNGIYVVTSVFPGVNQAILTRAGDFDDDAELTGGYRVAVLGGLSSNANRAFSTPGPITLNTTPVTWTDAGVSDYYAVYNPLTGVFSVTLADNYTAGNTTAPTRDDRPGGLSRGASGPASNIVAVTNGSNTVIITYDVTLGDNVEPNRQIINTATLTHVATSDGGVDDQPDPFDTAQVTIRRPTIAKTLTATEIEDSVNNRQQAVIGELITYTLTLTVPEGIMSSSTLTDTLDAGLAFVDVTGVSASSALTFTGGGLPTVGATPANTTIGAGGQTITFNFGAITNSNRDNTVEETIVITYRAIVLNTSANQSSAQRNNRVEFSWVVSGQGSYALTPVEAGNVTIIEPILGVAKTLPPGVYDAGDLIDYTITFSHTAGSQGTAYDAVLTDTLPIDPFGSGSLILTPTVLSVTDSAGTLTTADFTLTGSNATSWTLSNPTPVDVAPGRVVMITVRGTLSNAAMPGAAITNTAFLRWTSLDGTPGQRSTHNTASTERTGDDGPGGALNDYAATGSVAFIVPTVTPGKALIATSEAHTSGSNVAIGEIVRFRIAIGGPEASVYAFSLVDRLPQGLTFLNDGSARFVFIADNNITTAGVYDVAPVSCPAISPAGVTTLADVLNPATLLSSSINCTFGDSNISSNETVNQDVYASGTDVFFRFGNLSNNDNDAGEEFIVVEFNAIVDNDTFDPNDAGDVRSNTVVARMNPPGFGAFETAPSPEVTVTVVEPNIPFNAATNNKIATPTSGDAFDVITYTVTYTNATGATVTDAFDVRLLDVLPADTTLITGSVAVTSSCATGFTNSSAGNTVDVTVGRVPPGCSVTVTYQATLNVSVIPGQTITNTATLTYTSLPGNSGTGGFFGSTAGSSGSATGERNGSGGINDYAGNDTATVTIVAPTLAKRIVATSEAHTADPLVLADFTNTGFDGLTGSWNTNVFTYPTFVRISGSATESGGGYITFASPVDLSNHTALALSARLVAGNGANNIDVHLQDADGTNWRWRFSAGSFNLSTFTLVPQSLIGPNSTTIAAGTTPGLDLRNITRLEIRGDNGTAQFDIDIDAVIAFGNAAVPGEIVRYRLIATIPEGTSPNLQLVDNIPWGMRFVNDDTVRVAFISNSDVITSTSAGAQVPALSGAGLNITGNQDSVVGLSLAVGSSNGLAIGEGTAFDGNVSDSNNVGTDTDTFNDNTDVYFRLGNVVNNDNDDDLEFVVVEFNAQVLNTFNTGNQSGIPLNNDFRYFRSGIQVGATSVTNDVNRVTVVEPQINNLSKTISSAPPADAGDVFTYTLRFANGVAWPSSPAAPVRVATTGDIPGFNSTGGVGGTGQFANAPATVDGVTLNVGDRILVRSQTNPSQNGVYTLVFIDPFTGARTWDRAADLDSTAELAIGYRVIVQEGATLAGRTCYLDEPLPSSINAGPILWREIDPALTVAVATTGNLGGGTFDATGGNAWARHTQHNGNRHRRSYGQRNQLPGRHTHSRQKPDEPKPETASTA